MLPKKRSSLQYAFFSDEKGHVITIKYYKNIQGIYKVENVTMATEGYNLLPYLLPIDRKLIDPNYNFEPEEESNPQTDSKKIYMVVQWTIVA